MRSMATYPQYLLAYCEEHVWYEFDMLTWAAKTLTTPMHRSHRPRAT